MRVVRALSGVVAAVAVAALLAPSVGAQHSVEVLKEGESGNSPCGPFAMREHRPVEGDCTVEFAGPMEFYLHNGVSEMLFGDCEYRFEAVFNSIGFGYMYDQTLGPEGGACSREACDEGPGAGTGVAPHRNLEWPAQLNEAAAAESMRVVMCQRSFSSDPMTEGTPGATCVLDFIVETAGHDLELATEPDFQGNGGSPCMNFGGTTGVEAEGSFVAEQTESHPDDIEIRHLDD
jgi:hypothetical protein